MRLGCHGVFHDLFRNTTFPRIQYCRQALEAIALIAVKCFKSESNSLGSFLCHKRHKMSCGDLLNKFDDLVKRFREEFNKIVERERANLKAEVEALNAEKQRMEAIDVSDDDIIHLNVEDRSFRRQELHCVRSRDLCLPQCLTEGGKIV